MSPNSPAASTSQDRPLGQRLKHGAETKILIPVAVAIVSAAVSYLMKKLPLILEEKVLPKLQEKDAPEQLTNALEKTSSVVGGSDGDSPGQEEDSSEESESAAAVAPASSEASVSSEDREVERQKREQRRRERKRNMEKAA